MAAWARTACLRQEVASHQHFAACYVIIKAQLQFKAIRLDRDISSALDACCPKDEEAPYPKNEGSLLRVYYLWPARGSSRREPLFQSPAERRRVTFCGSLAKSACTINGESAPSGKADSSSFHLVCRLSGK